MQADAPTVVRIKLDKGEKYLHSIINSLIIDAVLYFNVGKSMSPEQVEQTSALIAEEFFFFKPQEFVYCFNEAKKGKYGKLYDRIDGEIIFEWLRAYDADRLDFVESVNEKNRAEKKTEPINYDMVKQFHAANPNYMERNKKDIEEAYSRFKAERMRDEFNKGI